MKRILTACLAALLILMLPLAAFATETEETAPATEATEATEATQETVPANVCGDDMVWVYDNGVLTVYGTGAMYDYADGNAPWSQYRDSITTVVFSGGVTYVGAGAFRDYDALTNIHFGDVMHTIGERAFQSCQSLTKIQLPATFRRFSGECFEGCTSLKEVYCAGGMPSFNFNCLWNYTNITVYCPVNNPWPASLVEELETNFGGRLQVLTADGEDIYNFEPEETEPATEAETEPVTEATTEPATEPAEAVTEPVTEPAVEETAEPETQPSEERSETVEETIQPAPTEEAEELTAEAEFLAGKSWIGILVIAGVLTLLLIGALIFRGAGRGGRYSR